MNSPQLPRLKSLVSRFKDAAVLVIGDLMLDEFIWGSVSRISPEAPVPVVWVSSENFMPGGACNVANNIKTLGGKVYIMGSVGADPRGDALIDLMRHKGVFVEDIRRDQERPTTLKTRVIAHHQQVVRIDREHVMPISKKALEYFLARIELRIPQVDAVCIEDYGKGMITPEIVRHVVRLGRRLKKVITVDPKEDHLSYYKGVTVITPNNHEASVLSRIKIKDDKSLFEAGAKLLKELSCENVLITQGEQGMALFQKAGKPVRIPTMAQAVFDVSGAGDTVIGTFTLARALKANPIEAAYLANCAAGVVVGKVGTAVVTSQELIDRVKWMMEKKLNGSNRGHSRQAGVHAS